MLPFIQFNKRVTNIPKRTCYVIVSPRIKVEIHVQVKLVVTGVHKEPQCTIVKVQRGTRMSMKVPAVSCVEIKRILMVMMLTKHHISAM